MARRTLDDLPDTFPHGTRSRYVRGCRCESCTKANLDAYHEREQRAKEEAALLGSRTETHCIGVHGEPCPNGTKLRKDSTGNICMRCRKKLVWNGLVPADRARAHLKELSLVGVGYKTAADAACVATSIVAKILSGERKQLRAQTERAILAVDEDAIADGATVDAGPVWHMIIKLMKTHGFTKAEISRRIGQNGRSLQLGSRRVTARNAYKVRKLYLDAEGAFLRR